MRTARSKEVTDARRISIEEDSRVKELKLDNYVKRESLHSMNEEDKGDSHGIVPKENLRRNKLR